MRVDSQLGKVEVVLDYQHDLVISGSYQDTCLYFNKGEAAIMAEIFKVYSQTGELPSEKKANPREAFAYPYGKEEGYSILPSDELSIPQQQVNSMHKLLKKPLNG